MHHSLHSVYLKKKIVRKKYICGIRPKASSGARQSCAKPTTDTKYCQLSDELEKRKKGLANFIYRHPSYITIAYSPMWPLFNLDIFDPPKHTIANTQASA